MEAGADSANGGRCVKDPIGALHAYQKMRIPNNGAEFVAAAQILGFDSQEQAHVRRAVRLDTLQDWERELDPGLVDLDEDTDAPDEAPLPLAVCALDAPPPEPVRWSVAGLIPAGEIGLLGADGGVGKTTLGLHIGGAIAGGSCVADHPHFKTMGGPVLFVSEEDPPSVSLNRLEALAVGHRWERDRVFGNLHLLALAGVKLTDLRWQLHLLAEVERIQPVGIILDPLFELVDGHEDSNTEQRSTVQFCRLLCRASGAAVIIIMHFGKAAEGKRKIDRLRGASAWYNAARFAYALEEREEGILVECLKMSRASKPAPFVLEREVTADPANEGTWLSASLRFRTPKASDMDHAERWVLTQLEEADSRMSTSDLKRAAVGSGVSGADVSGAISRLEKARRIDFESGPKNAKLWGAVCLPSDPGNQGNGRLPSLPDGCRASMRAPAVGCPPRKGAGNLAGAGQANLTDDDELERAAIETEGAA
jgi:hypothetical protein